MTQPILLLDTYSVLFRAQYALPPMNTSAGEPTSALYGFFSVFLKLLREHRPRGVAFALDAPAQTFRHARYEAYKATRDAAPEQLRPQLGRLDEILQALELPAFRVPGYEADDLLATLAARLEERGDFVLVVSGDRDLLQLASERTHVHFIGRRGAPAETYDPVAVRKRFGVEPRLLPDYVALVGDTSDNLPGVPGIGPRTAAALISSFGGTRELLLGLDRVSARTRRALEENRDQLVLNAELARLRTDVPLGTRELHGPLTGGVLDRLAEIFTALEFRSLEPRLEALKSVLATDAAARNTP